MSDALDSAVFERVLEFDGKTTGSLEAACKAVGPDFKDFTRLFELAASEDRHLQIAATWAIRKLLELGVELTVEQSATFIETAAAQTNWEAQLHIAQSVQFIQNENLDAQQLAEVITPWHTAKHPFLRAWTLDAVCHLALRDPTLVSFAKALMVKSEADLAASVRARAHNLSKSLNF